MPKIRVVNGENDLATIRPDLVEYWGSNNSIEPGQVYSGASMVVGWQCPLDRRHIWNQAINARAKSKVKCPVCENLLVIPGVNDAVSVYPELADQVTENNAVNLGLLSPKDNKHNIEWKCHHGHTWQTTVWHRARGTGCPVCAGKVVVAGFNDLSTTNPGLEKEWHPDNTRTPYNTPKGSTYKAKWQCQIDDSHIWTATVNDRANKSSGCPYCSGRIALPGKTDLVTFNEKLAQELDDESVDPSSIRPGARSRLAWKCADCGATWKASVKDRALRDHGCPRCASKVSKKELELREFIQELLPGEDIIPNSRSIVPPYEIDIFVPSHGLCVEFNGNFYHSDFFGKRTNDHLKMVNAVNSGYKFFAVWEDEWDDHKDIVKASLRTILGKSKEKVGARNTEVVELSYKESADFLDKHHIQGASRGSIYIGLKTTELVAVMVLTKSNGDLILDRYATSINVQGGHSKLISWVENTYDYGKLITFADLAKSSGNLYRTTGWVEDGTIKPDYRYLVRKKRAHKFNYRLDRFKSDPNLVFIDGKTEKELATINKLYRVYDYGKIRFIKERNG